MAGGETLDDFQTNNGEPVHVGMFVCLFPADPNAELYIARIDKMYKSEEGKRWIQILWFYRPKEVQHEPPSKALKNEVYHTNYFDCQPVESIANICKVFIKSEYLKLNEAQRRSVCEEDIFFFEYAYSAKNGSFTKMSASGNARLGRSLGKRNSSDRRMEASLKVLSNALIHQEEALWKDALPAVWKHKRSRWIANVKQCGTVHSISQGLLQLVESMQGKKNSNYLPAWKKAVLEADSSPASLLEHIDHLKIFLRQRSGNKQKKRKRYWSEHADNKDKLPPLQEVCEILDDSDKNVGRIKEGGLCKFLCDQLALKWGLRRKVKINRKPRSYEMTSTQGKLQENRMSCQQKQRRFTLDEDELAVYSQVYCMKTMNLNKENKMLPQEEDCGISKEMLKDLEAQVNCLIKEDDKELQIKSLGKAEVKSSQIECPVEHNTNLSGITMLRCNIVDRVERLETLDHTFLQEMESNHRAEKKQLEEQITKLRETLERVQEEMKSVLKSLDKSTMAARKAPSYNVGGGGGGGGGGRGSSRQSSNAAVADKEDTAQGVELSSENKLACKPAASVTVHEERGQPARTTFRICKPEGSFIWPSMSPKTSSTRVPVEDLLSSCYQLQPPPVPPPPSPASNDLRSVHIPILSEYSSIKTVRLSMDAKDNRGTGTETGMSSTLKVYELRSKRLKRLKDTAEMSVSMSSESQSVEMRAPVPASPHPAPERQKELISMYVSCHIRMSKQPSVELEIISQLGLHLPQPVPESSHSAGGEGEGEGGCCLSPDVPKGSVMTASAPHSSCLGLASSTLHNCNA